MAMMKRAGQLTARKSVSIAEAGLSDVWRTDCGRLNQETLYMLPCVLHLNPRTVLCTAIRLFGVMMLFWST
jgi:hypothetical protein